MLLELTIGTDLVVSTITEVIGWKQLSKHFSLDEEHAYVY